MQYFGPRMQNNLIYKFTKNLVCGKNDDVLRGFVLINIFLNN